MGGKGQGCQAVGGLGLRRVPVFTGLERKEEGIEDAPLRRTGGGCEGLTPQGVRLLGAGLLQGAGAGLLTRTGTVYPWGHFPLAAPPGRHLFPGKLSRTERGMWQSRQSRSRTK